VAHLLSAVKAVVEAGQKATMLAGVRVVILVMAAQAVLVV
jgi:hypothetical protein